VGHAFDFFLRPDRIDVITGAHRLIFVAGGETIAVLRNTLGPPPGVYDKEVEHYILAWIAAWKIGELLG